MANELFYSQRLIYRRLTHADAGGPYKKWLNDDDVNKFLTAKKKCWDESAIKAYIDIQNNNDSSILIGIFLKADGKHIGNIKIDEINYNHGRAVIGFMIGDKGEWGKGYATESLIAISEYADKELKLSKLLTGCCALNIGSHKSILKAGFLEEARRDKHFYIDREWHQQILFAKFFDLNLP